MSHDLPVSELIQNYPASGIRKMFNIAAQYDDLVNLTLGEPNFDTPNYIKAAAKKAIDEGANVAGYFAWSLLDNFEWLSGYTSKFGIVYVDFNTLERHPKASAYWFRDMLKH